MKTPKTLPIKKTARMLQLERSAQTIIRMSKQNRCAACFAPIQDNRCKTCNIANPSRLKV